LIIVFGAFYFIYQKLVSNQLLSLSQLKEQFILVFSNNIWTILVLLLFTDANWLLEMFKWNTLASITKKISFFEAYEQCLASLTASIITPNRIGEYGAKALFFEYGKRKKIMLLNLIGNLSQFTVTVLFGIIGFVFFIRNFNVNTPKYNIEKLMIFIVAIVIVIIFSKKLRLFKISNFLKQIPKGIYIKIVGLSLLRYLVFSHQFYFLLRMFGIETDYFTLMNLIFCMYLLASIVPSLTLFDWVIKGSFAVWLFGFIEINELTVLSIATIMWILNFGIPSLLGSIFVLNFKMIDKE
jgi:hypothetical protein